MSDNVGDLADRIAWAIGYLREKRGYSWPKIGKLLGVDKDTAAKYANGRGDLKGIAIQALRRLGFCADWLLSGYGEPFPGAREHFPEVCAPEAPQYGQGEATSIEEEGLFGTTKHYEIDDKTFAVTEFEPKRGTRKLSTPAGPDPAAQAILELARALTKRDEENERLRREITDLKARMAALESKEANPEGVDAGSAAAKRKVT